MKLTKFLLVEKEETSPTTTEAPSGKIYLNITTDIASSDLTDITITLVYTDSEIVDAPIPGHENQSYDTITNEEGEVTIIEAQDAQ